MSYTMSSNDYYAALNRRFDSRMRKLHKICRDTCVRWSQEQYAFVRGSKPMLSGSQVMNMPNRVFFDEISAIYRLFN